MPSSMIKCLVTIKQDAHPELYRELLAISDPRGRSERIRTFSTGFIKLTSGGLNAHLPASKDGINASTELDPSSVSVRESFISNFGDRIVS